MLQTHSNKVVEIRKNNYNTNAQREMIDQAKALTDQAQSLVQEVGSMRG